MAEETTPARTRSRKSCEYALPRRQVISPPVGSTGSLYPTRLADYLEQHNMRVASALQKQEVTRHLATHEPSVVILDLRLGKVDGLDLLREIRSRSDVPVIIASGHKRDEIDRAVGLDLGADDYVIKPLGLRELVARIRAVMRRHERGRIAWERKSRQGRCRFGGWELDRGLRRLTDPGGGAVTPTRREYALLIAFLDPPQRPLTRGHLLQATRAHEDAFDRSKPDDLTSVIC